AIALALELPYIQLEGFHFHSISNNLDAQLHVEMMRLYFQKAKAWAHQHGFTLHHLNLGGGIGVNYADLTQQFDWQTFVDGFHQVIDDEAMHEVSLNFECGRYLVAHIGYYVTEVLDIKRVHQAYYAILKGGTQQFRLP
ncbi:siderophore biosynthesis PLP-dependent protein, partial [Staphylococcus arlettae]